MDKNCRTIKPMLSAYVDGSLPSDRAWTVKMHLSACADCAAEASALDRAVSLLRSARAPRLSAGFDAALKERIAGIEPAKTRALSGSPLSRSAYSLRNWLSNMTRLQRLRLAVSTPLLAAAIAATLFFAMPRTATINSGAGAAMDPSFAAACVSDHGSFVAGQPLADPSAQALEQHVDTRSIASDGTNALDADGAF